MLSKAYHKHVRNPSCHWTTSTPLVKLKASAEQLTKSARGSAGQGAEHQVKPNPAKAHRNKGRSNLGSNLGNSQP